MKKNYYVDNNKFWQALKNLYDEPEATLKTHPDGDYIGDCIVKICTNLAYSSNFIGYTYRDELIDDGIENCIKYIRTFDPTRSKYAFTYFSKVAYYAFIRRLKKEKEQQYIKYKLISDSIMLNEFLYSSADIEDASIQPIIDSINTLMRDSEKFVETERKKEKEKKQPKEHANSVARFFD